jgi:DNA-binding transcriptional ArsR family regulator
VEKKPGFDAARDVVLDPRSLRALAHPLRVRLLGELREHGPATATQLAARVGESSGLTSYHLRQLAAAGFLAEEPDRASGRERWWRAVHRSTWFDTDDVGPQDRGPGAEYLRAVAGRYAHRMLRFVESLPPTPVAGSDPWELPWDLSDWALALTDSDARELRVRIHEVLEAFRGRETSPADGARRMTVQVQMFPTGDGEVA